LPYKKRDEGRIMCNPEPELSERERETESSRLLFLFFFGIAMLSSLRYSMMSLVRRGEGGGGRPTKREGRRRRRRRRKNSFMALIFWFGKRKKSLTFYNKNILERRNMFFPFLDEPTDGPLPKRPSARVLTVQS